MLNKMYVGIVLSIFIIIFIIIGVSLKTNLKIKTNNNEVLSFSEVINRLSETKGIIVNEVNYELESSKYVIKKNIIAEVEINSIITIISEGIENKGDIVYIGPSYKLEMLDVNNNLITLVTIAPTDYVCLDDKYCLIEIDFETLIEIIEK